MAKLYPDDNNKFINPYNFISLTSEVERKQEEYGAEERTLTGYISCKMRVADMLALPDRSAEDKNKPGHFDFYKIDDKPVIPGSEIRGCIRSVYEAVTKSCLSVINNNILSGRLMSPENDIQPGILMHENDEWVIYEAEKLANEGAEKAVLEREWRDFFGKDFKKTYFYIRSNKPAYKCTREDIERFKNLLDIYIENSKSDKKPEAKKYCEILNEMKKAIAKKNCIPVFYKLDDDGELSYFSPAQISRRVFKNTVTKLLGPHANDCGKGNGYCPACRLFGTLGNDKPKQYPLASRVRFSDATANDKIRINDSYINFPELSAPKITSVEFYSSKGDLQTNVRQWTYDDYGVTLNGRKFYYHSTPKREKELGERSIATKPVCASEGGEFSFKVYFDKISLSELVKLLWVLTVGENDPQSRMMHKLGYGRPVGYGSVKITVDEVVERSIGNGTYNLSYKSFSDYGVSDAAFAEKEALAKFKLIANYDYVSGQKVSYPVADTKNPKDKNPTAHFHWFVGNRRFGKFKYVLPKLTTDPRALSLPAMVGSLSNYSQNNQGQQGQQRNGNNGYKGFDFSKFVMGCEYAATVTGIKNDKFVWIEVEGERTSVFGKYIKGDVIKVIYKGKNQKDDRFPRFEVAK